MNSRLKSSIVFAETKESHVRYNERHCPKVSLRAEYFTSIWTHSSKNGPDNARIFRRRRF